MKSLHFCGVDKFDELLFTDVRYSNTQPKTVKRPSPRVLLLFWRWSPLTVACVATSVANTYVYCNLGIGYCNKLRLLCYLLVLVYLLSFILLVSPVNIDNDVGLNVCL